MYHWNKKKIQQCKKKLLYCQNIQALNLYILMIHLPIWTHFSWLWWASMVCFNADCRTAIMLGKWPIIQVYLQCYLCLFHTDIPPSLNFVRFLQLVETFKCKSFIFKYSLRYSSVSSPRAWRASSRRLGPSPGRTRATSVHFWSRALRWRRSVCSQAESYLTNGQRRREREVSCSSDYPWPEVSAGMLQFAENNWSG